MNSETLDARWNRIGAPLASQAVAVTAEDQRQYSLGKILSIWALAALPMALLGWVIAPIVSRHFDFGVGEANNDIFARAVMLTLGLIWQFVFIMAVIYREEGNLRLSTIRRRCWLNRPRDPKTGAAKNRLWLWLLPATLVIALLQMAQLESLVGSVVPFLGEPDRYSFAELMQSDERKAALEGAWQVLGLFIVLGIFNTIIGEELLFRGLLLPRMRGVFGKGDWLANGILFAFYHLHQPWSIPGSIVDGVFCYALPSRRYHSIWYGILVHSLQTVFFIVIALGLVLGFA